MQQKSGFKTNIKSKQSYQMSTFTRQKVILRAKTAIKEQSSAGKAMKNNQTYQNVLNRLLRLNKIRPFLQQSSKYVIFKDDYIKDFKISKQGVRRSLRLVASLGNFLLKDGGFIKHYCYLLQDQYSQERREQIRRHIFQTYQKNIDLRIAMFEKYFAHQRKIQIQELSVIEADKKLKKSTSNKKKVIKLDKVPEIRSIETGTKNQESNEITETVAENTNIFNDSKKQNQNNFNNFYQQQQNNPQIIKSTRKTIRKSVKKTPEKVNPYEQRDDQNSIDHYLRIQQLKSQSKSKKWVIQPKSIIKFKDQMEQNPILKKCYQEIEKIQDMRKSIAKSKAKKQQNSYNEGKLMQARRRFSNLNPHSTQKEQFKNLTQDQKLYLTQIERQLLKQWPRITLFAYDSSVKINKQSPIKVLGSFGSYKLLKAMIVSKNQKHFNWGLIMVPLTAQQRPNYKLDQFQVDDQIVIFVQQIGLQMALFD